MFSRNILRRFLTSQFTETMMHYHSTAIEAREKPKNTHRENGVDVIPPKKKGRPKKGEVRPSPEPTRIEKQLNMSLDEMLDDLPKRCDKGAKKDSKGNTMYPNFPELL